MPKNWEQHFARLHYEPEHETGNIAATCWCGPKIYVRDGMTYIDHFANRDVLIEFVRQLLTARENGPVL